MAKSRRVLLATMATLMMATELRALTCYVCLPPVIGDKLNKDTSMLMRANITRTFPDITEDLLGECSALTKSETFMKLCPTEDEYSTCSIIRNNSWEAGTCGRMTPDHAVGEFKRDDGSTVINCLNDLCNKVSSSASRFAVAGLALLLAAFFSVFSAA